MARPFIVGIGGFESNVGKTTLLCELLREFPDWEAIKTTRGHYRSCGKDPHACCVSHLLTEEPLVLSGRRESYADGKDTGRYWIAGAANVHWLIVTENQLERGINQILQRVKSPGVLIEGNSFTKFVKPDYFLLVKSRSSERIKTTARQSMHLANAIYESDSPHSGRSHRAESLTRKATEAKVYSRADYSSLVDDLHSRFLSKDL